MRIATLVSLVVLALVVLAAWALRTTSADPPYTIRAAPKTASQEKRGNAFVIDDAASSNPSLVPQEVVMPPGLEHPVDAVALPPGFSISLLATGLERPRFMAVDQLGNLLVAAAQSGSLHRYPAREDGSIGALAEPPPPLATGLSAPSSLALHEGYLYVGETDKISRYRYGPRGPLTEREIVVPNLPVGGHSTRTVVFGPDNQLYVSVGSSCNICDEADERRASVLRYDSSGGNGERFARGLRNAVGLAFQPDTGQLWATVNERDRQGNEIPPDLVTIVGSGENFGWPDCQPPNARPQSPGADCSDITPPTIGIQAHSAPLGLAFSTGSAFPPEYRGDLIVAQHGSWNREPPAAPKLLRIRFEGGRPVSAEDFATGWQRADHSRWGRPSGLVVALDGSLIVSDDAGGVLYRIAYTG
jgi:glucose/arabinose dehydrogenase